MTRSLFTVAVFFLIALSGIAQTTFELQTYEEESHELVNAKYSVGKFWGIQFTPVEIDLTDSSQVYAVIDRNEIVEEKLKEEYGYDWEIKFREQLEIEFEEQAKARKIATEILLKKGEEYAVELNLWLEKTDYPDVYTGSLNGPAEFDGKLVIASYMRIEITTSAGFYKTISEVVEISDRTE